MIMAACNIRGEIMRVQDIIRGYFMHIIPIIRGEIMQYS